MLVMFLFKSETDSRLDHALSEIASQIKDITIRVSEFPENETLILPNPLLIDDRGHLIEVTSPTVLFESLVARNPRSLADRIR